LISGTSIRLWIDCLRLSRAGGGTSSKRTPITERKVRSLQVAGDVREYVGTGQLEGAVVQLECGVHARAFLP